MKNRGLSLSLLLASLVPVSAQLTVEVAQTQDQFLPGEALPTAVRITNRSGQTLRLGAEEDWLTFSIEGRDGGRVTKLSEVPVTGPFVLDSSKMATKRVDLAPYFSVTKPGRYSITATVRIKQWNLETNSPPRDFFVIEGAKLWEQEFGVPKSGEAGDAPEVRKYILQQANYIKGELRLYLRVTDVTGARIFRVSQIGPIVSFSRPDFRVDKLSNLHVLYQNWAHSFSYTVFNPDGDLISRQTYDYETTRPHFQTDAAGKLSVAGGVRVVSANDVPPPQKP